MEECHKLLTDQVDDAILRYNVSKPLPLGGDPGHVTIQSDFFFNKDLEYLRYDRKMGRTALSISKIKTAYYPDVGLEQIIPNQIWIEEECKYDIAAMYGISHWWFQRQWFYIDRHTSEGDRKAVRTHMHILSVIRIKVFSMYGYNYMKKIVLRRVDLKEYVIAERDFKYLYPSDFEDLNMVIRQRVKDLLLGIESYQMQLNLTKPRWDAKGFEYKHDFTVIDSPKAITFRDKYEVQMIMRFNEIHKFSDGTLQQIDEALDYRSRREPKGLSLGCLIPMNSITVTFEEQTYYDAYLEKCVIRKGALFEESLRMLTVHLGALSSWCSGKSDTMKVQPLPKVVGKGMEKGDAVQAS
ncbi:hypothetical protein Tco_0018364 [Tanacetum coccineum]